MLISSFFSLDVGTYILRISDVESAFEDDSDFGRIFLGGEGVENVCVLIGVDDREKDSERTAYSLLQMDFRCPAVNADDDPDERYYSRENHSLETTKQ